MIVLVLSRAGVNKEFVSLYGASRLDRDSANHPYRDSTDNPDRDEKNTRSGLIPRTIQS